MLLLNIIKNIKNQEVKLKFKDEKIQPRIKLLGNK